MKTLKEPQEPFCPPFSLPLSPLSRRPRVAFCAFNQQLCFLSSRDLMSVFCPDSLSLSCKTTKKRARRDSFFRIKKHKKRLFPPPKFWWKDLSCVFFHFCAQRDPPTAGIRKDKKDTPKPRYLNRN